MTINEIVQLSFIFKQIYLLSKWNNFVLFICRDWKWNSSRKGRKLCYDTIVEMKKIWQD